MKPVFVALALLAVSLVANSARADIRNGSFETPDAPDGGMITVSKGEKFAGWKVVDQTGNVFIVGPNFFIGTTYLPAKKGAQWICLTGSSRTRTGVQQKVSTIPGKTYILSFYVGNINDPRGGLGSSSAVKLYIDGKLWETARNSSTAASRLRWKAFSTRFTAAFDTTTIKFINGDGPEDGINGLDAVSLTELP
jgi:hypothetical protein